MRAAAAAAKERVVATAAGVGLWPLYTWSTAPPIHRRPPSHAAHAIVCVRAPERLWCPNATQRQVQRQPQAASRCCERWGAAYVPFEKPSAAPSALVTNA